MALPQGWKDQREVIGTGRSARAAGSLSEFGYQTNITVPKSVTGLSSGETYLIKFDPNFGKTQVYIPNPVFGDSLQFSIDQNGQVLNEGRQNLNNLLSGTNGKQILDYLVKQSREATNKLIDSTDPKGLTAAQKTALAKTKRFASSETDNTDTGGSNSRQPTPESGANFPFGALRTVENFNAGDTGYKNFKYPTTIESGQDYMIINIFNYKVADIFGSGGVANISPGAFLAGQSLSSREFFVKKESLANIRLPVPNNVMEANQTKWGSSELNNLAAGLLAGATGTVAGVAAGDFMTAGEYTSDTVKNILGGNTPGKTLIKQQLTLGAASNLINKLGVKVDAEAFRSRATGTVVNPNLELLFNGPSLRQFQFQYKLTPRSLEEAKQIRGIIKTFKKAMAPKRGTAAEDAFFLGAPNVFQLKFMRGTGENKYLPSIKTCALTNFSANYTADGFYSAYYDGQPISIDIVLQFGELTPIYNDHYTIDTESVGFNKDLNSLEKSTTAPVTNEPAAEPPAPPGPPAPPRGGPRGQGNRPIAGNPNRQRGQAVAPEG